MAGSFLSRIDVPAAVAAIVDELKTAGVAATAEPNVLNPPCAWVTARSVSHDLFVGGGTVHLEVYLIAPDNGTSQALRTLTDLLDRALTVLDPDGDTDLSAAVTIPGTAAALPAFKLSVDYETQ